MRKGWLVCVRGISLCLGLLRRRLPVAGRPDYRDRVADHVWTLREPRRSRLKATLASTMQPYRSRESGMRWALRFFGLSREQGRQPAPRREILAGLVLAVIGLVVWLATSPSHHAFSLHRLGIVVFGVGLGSAGGGWIRRRRAKRASSN
jgi:hypothetical protein